MSEYNYKIQLIPVDDFYFGSTQCFGENNSNTYLLKSEQWPQQTAVLGMLRKEVLVQNGLIREKYNTSQKETLAYMIGKRGFTFGSPERENDFGCIKATSPLFIEDNEQRLYTQCPRDCNPLAEKEYHAFAMEDRQVIFYHTGQQKAMKFPVFKRSCKEYDPKKGVMNTLASIYGLQLRKLEDCFELVERIGICKLQNDNAFYKLASYRMHKEQQLRFTMYISIDEKKLKEPLKSNFVQVGNKYSLFYMKATRLVSATNSEQLLQSPAWEAHKKYVKENYGYSPIWLLSDTYFSQEALAKVDFTVSASKKFRYISNAVGGRGFNRSKETYQFLSRGSVLYCKEEEEVKKAINAYRFLKQIGYNFAI